MHERLLPISQNGDVLTWEIRGAWLGTELSVSRFLIEYFTPLTLGEQYQGALSDEDVTEVWAAANLEAMSKVRKMKGFLHLSTSFSSR